MSKTIKNLSLSGLICTAGFALSAPAFAQLGGVTGSVSGSVDGTVDTMTRPATRLDTNTDLRTKTDIKARTPDLSGAADVKVSTPAKATVRTGTYSGRTYHGPHYHGTYYHDHGHYGYDHFHDHSDAHTHGYAKLVVKIDNTDQPIGPLLTYGTSVRSKKDKDLGQIIGLTRTQSGAVSYVMVDEVPRPIPVETLRADGDILVTSMKKKKLK